MIKLFILLFIYLSPFTNGQDTLVGVQALWRHGDRPPEVIFDYDPHKNDWPVPLGELSPRGMRQHYDLGKRLFERYAIQHKFINPNYTVSEIHVRSTSVNRALASAYSNLAGMFSKSSNTYPNDGGDWPKNWTPIPVHTEKQSTDYLLNSNYECPRLQQLSTERLNTKQFLLFEESLSNLFKYLTLNSGVNVTGYKVLKKLYGTIHLEKTYYNYSQPSWLTSDIFYQMETVVNTSINYSYGCAGFGLPEDTELISLKQGHLVWKMIDNMKQMKDNKNIEKYIAYSAHDTTLMAFANVLGAKVSIMGKGLIDYAATFLLELWKTSSGEYYLELLYANNAYGEFKPVTYLINGCKNKVQCSIEDFEEGTKKYLLHHPENYCAAK
ncbi:Histidine phosphatase superfamily, clade-2-containing protein [Strongyloides ratti]|uniref:acid phosphatase n=1 Tax=Strongyloides ratti TaxID=34506 RepID=A0A090KZZ8_STRRB|nr:Histidine phosphatase superfamily, clade-2-containing protein [Strongyloides ratti]CEF63001.1 Histidine phosphatase superfamily, clade-2-containing protein [Strongyloides ratti]